MKKMLLLAIFVVIATAVLSYHAPLAVAGPGDPLKGINVSLIKRGSSVMMKMTFPETLSPCGGVTVHPSSVAVSDVNGFVYSDATNFTGYAALITGNCAGTYSIADTSPAIHLTSTDGNSEIVFGPSSLQVLDTNTLLPTTLWNGHVIVPGSDATWDYFAFTLSTPVPAIETAGLIVLGLAGLIIYRKRLVKNKA